MIPIPFFYYYAIVISIITALTLAAIIGGDIKAQRLTLDENKQNIILNKETDWVKVLTNISLLTLTACLAGLYTPLVNDSTLRTLTGVMALASLLNLFFGVYIHLSGYFNLSYRAEKQRENSLHRALFRLSVRLSPYWHLPPFIVSLVQLVIAGHIIIALFFC